MNAEVKNKKRELSPLDRRIADIEDEIFHLSHIEAKLRRYLKRKPIAPREEAEIVRELWRTDRRITRAMAEMTALEGYADARRAIVARNIAYQPIVPAKPVRFFGILDAADLAAEGEVKCKTANQ